MFRDSAIVPILFSFGLLAAQNSPVSGPVEGFVFDAPTKSLRAVTGVLGAASLGPALVSEIEFGAVAPHRDFAIGYKSERCILVSGLGSGAHASSVISDSCALPEAAAWSGDGTTAVLYSRTGNWFRVVTGLPEQPSVKDPVSLAPSGGSLSAVSLDLRGTRIFVGATGNSAGVYQVQTDQSLIPVLPLPQPIALSVSEERQVLYALDAAGNQIYEMNLTDASSQSWTIPDLLNPVALQPGRDSKQRPVVYVAGGTDQVLATYDATSHASVASVQLDFPPNLLEILGPHSFVLRNRTSDTDPVWSFTDTSEPAAVYFIPATPLAVSGGLQ